MRISSSPLLLFIPLCLFVTHSLSSSSAGDSINPTQSIRDGAVRDTLVSAGGRFALGFFSPGSSKNRYLGIWFNGVPGKPVVWVANRQTPVTDSTGVLNLTGDGTLILYQNGKPIWSSSSGTSSSNATNPVAQLSDYGNLVVKNMTSSGEQILWQSFDYPTDTMLPTMKIGEDQKTGLKRFLTSWNSPDDPSPGEFTYRLTPGSGGSYELYLRGGNGTTIIYRSGPWNGVRFSGNPRMGAIDTDVPYIFNLVNNEEEVSYSYQAASNEGNISRVVVRSQIGVVDREFWNGNKWDNSWTRPKDYCDPYNVCGPNGLCNNELSNICSCDLPGFEPKGVDLRLGCRRKEKLNCSDDEVFVLVEKVKLPDTANSTVYREMNFSDCESQCKKNCSCTAYAAADISSGIRMGCIFWFGDIFDVRKLNDSNQDSIFLRRSAPNQGTINSSRKMKLPRVIVIIVSIIASLVVVAFVILCGAFIWKKRKTRKEVEIGIIPTSNINDKNWEEELPLFDFSVISLATQDFAIENKIGKGGFGPVYKGTLGDGQVVAIKRLSSITGQGLDEFMNEVMLIARLQHRNLVRLLGCCIERGERILIYEYMQNKSLDTLIFGESQRALLDWKLRVSIILGVARGLLYLHEDSRLKIIHRDLKAGNILLDESMNPKISDFGIARIFNMDQTEENTRNVIGTIGYMSPEYAMDGVFSVKSDVFSFGVLMLEIISGMKNMKITKNRTSFQQAEDKNLLALAWRLWQEGNSLKLLDETIEPPYPTTEVLRYIHIGLLCVQESPIDRPTMPYLILMLNADTMLLPEPKRPGIYQGRVVGDDQVSTEQEIMTNITVTVLEGR